MTVLLHEQSAKKASHSALDPLELEELDELLLSELSLSIQSTPGAVESAADKRSPSATSLRLLMQSIVVQGLRGGVDFHVRPDLRCTVP